MKIVDTFTFNNELDVLEIRFAELYDVVDYFVVIEATKTQTLKDKPLYFQENIGRFDKWKDKIVPHVVDKGFPDNKADLWQMENFQRNQILEPLEELPIKDSSIVMVSDVDEIPKAQIVKDAVSRVGMMGRVSFDMSFFAYYLNLISPNKGWKGTVVGTYEDVKSNTPQGWRNTKDHIPAFPDGGWHLSWQGGFEKFYEKIYSCIEPLDKSKIPPKDECFKLFSAMVRDGGNFVHADNPINLSVPLRKIEKLEGRLPKYVSDNPEKFQHLIF